MIYTPAAGNANPCEDTCAYGPVQGAWMVGFISYVLRTVLLVHLTIGYGVALVRVSRTGHHSAVDLISMTVASLMAVWLQHAL